MSSYIPIIAIVVVVAMILGPVMMLQPSSSQRFIADLRALALKNGLQVKKHEKGVDYFKRSDQDLSLWILERQAFEHGVHFHKDWDGSVGSVLSKEQQRNLKLWLNDLALEPALKIHAMGANSMGVYVRLSESTNKLDVSDYFEVLSSKLNQLALLCAGD